MYIIQIAADMTHLVAIIILLIKIWKSACRGVSGKTQILYTVVYCTRYLDLFVVFISIYNTTMKIAFIGASLLTNYFIYVKFKKPGESEIKYDSFRLEFLLIPCALLALVVNHEFSFLEVLWTFSIYLETVAILPQFFVSYKTGEVDFLMILYLIALWLYRELYMIKWVCRYLTLDIYDLISICAGIVQTTLYLGFFCILICIKSRGENLANNLKTSALPLSSEDNLKNKEKEASLIQVSEHNPDDAILISLKY